MSDAVPYLSNTDYFFIGNGKMMAAIQWSRNPSASPYGIILCDPERMSRKNGSLLFHPELGLARTMLTIVADGVRYTPRHNDVHVSWSIARTSSVVVRWQAGPVGVTERFSVHNSSSMLVRDVTLGAEAPCTVQAEAALYANPLFFDEFGARNQRELYAMGYASINLYSISGGSTFERFLTVPAAITHGSVTLSFAYVLEAVGTHEFALYPSDHAMSAHHAATVTPPAEPETLQQRMMHMHAVAATSLRACVSALGKFDAAIWQYDFEWGLDAAMVAAAATMTGAFDVARSVLNNILRRLANAEGKIAEASRFRGGELSELNGNGAVLDALWQYWRWSGDDTLMRAQWERIEAIAEYPLRAEFAHESGLLATRRDFWERTPWMGVLSGMEVGHQTLCAVGLRGAARMAEALGHTDRAERWRAASERLSRAMIEDPRFSLVENGRIVRRRLADGTVQEMIAPDTSYADPNYAPYIPAFPSADLQARPCEPDATEALPIIYGLVDPAGPVAAATVEAFEALWNPSGSGGYARYHPASDPDSPGAWPFATAFIAAAELETGRMDRAQRSITWLLDAAGAGGSWFEFYGTRQSPPYPPVGIIVWGWAQYLILMTRHVFGAAIDGDHLRVRPRMSEISGTLYQGRHALAVTVAGLRAAVLDGRPIEMHDGAVLIPLPLAADHRLEFVA